MLTMAEVPEASQKSQLVRFRTQMLELAKQFPKIQAFADTAEEASIAIAELK